MKPNEKLEEIEKWHFLPETIKQVGPQSHFDMNWLIARVKRLTEALEKIEYLECLGTHCSTVGKISRKALEEAE